MKIQSSRPILRLYLDQIKSSRPILKLYLDQINVSTERSSEMSEAPAAECQGCEAWPDSAFRKLTQPDSFFGVHHKADSCVFVICFICAGRKLLQKLSLDDSPRPFSWKSESCMFQVGLRTKK